MRLVTAEQMRELDRRTMNEWGTSGEELMDRAGQGVADVVRRLAEGSGFLNPRVLFFAGRGNNGGDAFTAARHLKENGLHAEVWLAGVSNQVGGDALKQLSRMKSAGVPLRELPTKEDWDVAASAPAAAEILVDGLLGTGSRGPARGPAVGAIQYINAHAAEALVVSIDLPSGLDADTGTAQGDAVHADVTVTMALPKTGLVQAAALEFVGSVEVVDIGIPDSYVEQLGAGGPAELIYATDLRPLFARRPRGSHKGHYGHVLLVGGARGYAGAITLAARAAVRSGAGLVSVLTPASVASVVAGGVPEAMVHPAGETEAGALDAALLDTWAERLEEFSAVLVGPGLTRGAGAKALTHALLAASPRPLVLDADALAVLAGDAARVKTASVPLVLTPHPGEMALLSGHDVSTIQDDRPRAALEMAARTGCTVVLKGAGTIVARADGTYGINMTGNPGMATGGAGDVLAGLLTGLLGQGLAPYAASASAVYLHGRAGDMAAWRRSQAGLTAGDIADELP